MPPIARSITRPGGDHGDEIWAYRMHDSSQSANLYSRLRIKNQGNRVGFWWPPKIKRLLRKTDDGSYKIVSSAARPYFLPALLNLVGGFRNVRFPSAGWMRFSCWHLKVSGVFPLHSGNVWFRERKRVVWCNTGAKNLSAHRMASGQSMARARLLEAISPKRNRQSAHTDPPEPAAPEGILFSEALLVRKFHRRKPERETRIPGLAQARARPKRGACRRERGASRTPMAERTRKGSLWRRAVQSAATKFVLHFGLPQLAAQRTLVVKISDTSLHGKSGFESRLWRHVPWKWPREGRCVAGPGSSARKHLRWCHWQPISPVPQRAFAIVDVRRCASAERWWRCLLLRVERRPLLRFGGRVVRIPPAEMS